VLRRSCRSPVNVSTSFTLEADRAWPLTNPINCLWDKDSNYARLNAGAPSKFTPDVSPRQCFGKLEGESRRRRGLSALPNGYVGVSQIHGPIHAARAPSFFLSLVASPESRRELTHRPTSSTKYPLDWGPIPSPAKGTTSRAACYAKQPFYCGGIYHNVTNAPTELGCFFTTYSQPRFRFSFARCLEGTERPFQHQRHSACHSKQLLAGTGRSAALYGSNGSRSKLKASSYQVHAGLLQSPLMVGRGLDCSRA